MTLVAVLTTTPALYDARVLRTAETLGEAFGESIVVAGAQPGLPPYEWRNGVEIIRIPMDRPLAGAGGAPLRALGAVRFAHRDLARLLESRFFMENAVHALAGRAIRSVHAMNLSTLSAAAALGERSEQGFVYDPAELELFRNARYFFALRRQRAQEERRYIYFARSVLAPSPGCADVLARLYGIPRPAVVFNVPKRSPEAPLCEDSLPLRVRLGLHEDRPLAAYVGFAGPGRGLESILAALARPPARDIAFALLGTSHPDVERAVVARIDSLGLKDRVYRLPAVPPESVVPALSGVEMTVIAMQDTCLSYRYALPNKLFQSIWAGVPAIVPQLEGFKAFAAESGCVLLVDTEDSDALAGAMRRLCDPAERERLAAPMQLTRDTYAWPVQAKTLVRAHCMRESAGAAAQEGGEMAKYITSYARES